MRSLNALIFLSVNWGRLVLVRMYITKSIHSKRIRYFKKEIEHLNTESVFEYVFDSHIPNLSLSRVLTRPGLLTPGTCVGAPSVPGFLDFPNFRVAKDVRTWGKPSLRNRCSLSISILVGRLFIDEFISPPPHG